tara:strand:- start:7618 stop:7791 length:174 start_codon:yes stop_codon:yes gene_type:complete
MILSEQPGRILAIFVFAPLILCKGIKYKDYFLVIFSIVLFVWEVIWVMYYPAKRVMV